MNEKLLSIRLVPTVVDVHVEIPLQSEERLADHVRFVRVKLDAFDEHSALVVHK